MNYYKKNLILLAISLILLMGICAILTFLMPESTVQRFSLFASMVLGLGSLFVSVTAMFIAFKEMRNNERDRQNRLEENAESFISENAEEIEYIPLCLIAFAYDKHHKFVRKIYNQFNLLNIDTKKEVLKQLEYNYNLILNNEWIDEGISFVDNFIKINNLGDSMLYDSGKYYTRSINYSSEPFNSVVTRQEIFKDIFSYNPKIKIVTESKLEYEGITFSNFLFSFLEAKKSQQ